jgi:glycosyltransferase involved in cell wall biosynthesis
VTQRVKEVWERIFTRVVIVPLTVDVSRFQPNEHARQRVRNEWGMLPGAIVLGFAGRMVKEKGIHTLVGALRHVLGAERNVFAVLAGDGPLRLEAQRALSGLPVMFPGYVPHAEMHHWMRGWDVLILPSETAPGWTEQFGRVIVEAAALGIPTVGSLSGEIPALVDEFRGWTFPERDETALSRVIRQAVKAVRACPVPWLDLRQRVMQKFTKTGQARMLLETFESVVKNG